MAFFSQFWAQDVLTDYKFVSIKEGISKVGVFSIVQDDSGFIWLGTNGSGLYRYNGIDYDSYKHILNDTTSISSSLVYCSFLDSKKRLWFGTEEGLNLYDKEHDVFKRISILGVENKHSTIRSLAEDHDGNLYIGTQDLGLYKLNIQSLSVEKIAVIGFSETSTITVHTLAIDNHGKLLVGTNLGLGELDQNTLVPSKFSSNNDDDSLKNSIKSILFDAENNVWIGTESEGLIFIKNQKDNTINNTKISHIDISDNIIFSIISLPDNTIMCGTENDGLFHLDASGNILRNYKTSKSDNESLSSNSIWSLFLDRNKRIWMGYYNTGVSVYDKLYDKFQHIESIKNTPNSLQIPSVTAITEDNTGNLWLCMDGGGIDILNTDTNIFTHISQQNNTTYKGLASDYIETIFVDNQENIWAGSWDKGLFFLKKGSKTFINYNVENSKGALRSNTVMSISEDSKGIIWIGTYYNGLHSFNPKTKTFIHYNSEAFRNNNLPTLNILKVLVDADDNLWLGTVKGLFKVIRSNNENNIQVISYTDKMSLEHNTHSSANHILSLKKDENQMLWIGTRGAGLCKYDIKADTFTWFNYTKGLKEDNICSIVESLDGNLWLAGNSGITKFDKKTNNFTNYTNHDGLLSNDYNINSAFRDREGVLYFGNFKGVDYFNPDKIEVNKNLSSLYLSGLKIANKNVIPGTANSPLLKVISETDSISLNSNQSVFTIEYSGINYTRPEENEYAYYLEGYETDWNYVGKNRSATYTNLDPGNYTFKLKASNNDGIWNETPLSLSIIVLPPWWKTTLAVYSYIILFLLGLFILNKMTQSRLKEKQTINNERIIRLQEKELDEKKFQFFTNISHEFRTPLTLILSPLKDIINDDSFKLPERISEKHKVIYKNTDRLYRLINELLDFRKLELNKVNIRAKELNLVNFSSQILSHFKEEALNRNIQLSLDADIADLSVWADESMLEKIIFNLLSNAFKITPESGIINVSIHYNDTPILLPLVNPTTPVKSIEIDISDTGPGLDKHQLTKIFERFYQVEQMNKTYYGSTGIGLEVVQNFVQLHKGKIIVDSIKGEGTTFRIILPSGNSHFEEAELSSEKAELLSKKEQFEMTNLVNNTNVDEINKEETLGNQTLLIVEDNTELRNYLKSELKQVYRVIVAINGKEGLFLAQENLPDIILTDVIMPEMNGLDFCQNIKKDIRTSHIPLLMLTAKARIDDRIESVKFGADAYMVKPFDMRLLKVRLAQLITSRQLIFNKYFSVISDTPTNGNTTSLDKAFIDKVLNFINKNIGNPDLSVELLASELNLSRSQFYRKVKALTNQTASEFLRNIRLQKAKQLIELGNTNIGEVCFIVGFSSASYFTKCFKSSFGILPTEVETKQA